MSLFRIIYLLISHIHNAGIEKNIQKSVFHCNAITVVIKNRMVVYIGIWQQCTQMSCVCFGDQVTKIKDRWKALFVRYRKYVIEGTLWP